jgi:hypothetical protein
MRLDDLEVRVRIHGRAASSTSRSISVHTGGKVGAWQTGTCFAAASTSACCVASSPVVPSTQATPAVRTGCRMRRHGLRRGEIDQHIRVRKRRARGRACKGCRHREWLGRSALPGPSVTHTASGADRPPRSRRSAPVGPCDLAHRRPRADAHGFMSSKKLFTPSNQLFAAGSGCARPHRGSPATRAADPSAACRGSPASRPPRGTDRSPTPPPRTG